MRVQVLPRVPTVGEAEVDRPTAVNRRRCCKCTRSPQIPRRGRAAQGGRLQSDSTQVQLLSACPLSGRKSVADSRAWNSEAAGASPAVLTNFGCEAHADEHRPDKSEVAGANPAAATKSRGRAWCAASLPTRHGTVRLRSPAPIRPGRRTGRRPSKPTTLVRVQLGAPYPRRWERRRFPKSPTVSSSLTAGAAKLTGISIPG